MLQLPVVILKKSSISDMQHRKTYNYFNFQQNWVSIDQSKPCTQMYLQQDAREAMRVVNFCTYKTYLYAQNYFRKNKFKYCFKSYIKLHEYANCNSANYDV